MPHNTTEGRKKGEDVIGYVYTQHKYDKTRWNMDGYYNFPFLQLTNGQNLKLFPNILLSLGFTQLV